MSWNKKIHVYAVSHKDVSAQGGVLEVGRTVSAVRPFLLSRLFYGLHGEVADISEININLLLGGF